MGLMNKQNIDKQQAINTAKDTLFDFQNEPYLRELIVNPASSDEFEFIERIDDFNFFKFKGKKNGFDVTVKLKVKPDIGSGGGRELYQIHIQLLNHKGTLITETYGYIVLD